MADIGLSLTDIPLLAVRCIIAFYYTLYLMVLQAFYYLYPKKGKSLREKHVLITGAGGALGRELALCFAREGCRVTCVDVNLAEAHETASLVSQVSKYCADHVHSYFLDVTDRVAIRDFARRLNVEVGPLDILVNNAGIVQAGSILDVTDDQINSIMNVNLMAHFWTVRTFLPSMLERNTGHIVGISSAAALAVASNIAPYTASKAGVSAFMGCLREEIRKKQSNVKVTTVQPFFLAPPQHKKHWEVKSVLPDITAHSVAASTVRAIKRETVTLTIPTYLFFLMYLVRFVPAKASDMWRDAFAADIDSLDRTKSKQTSTIITTRSLSSNGSVTSEENKSQFVITPTVTPSTPGL